LALKAGSENNSERYTPTPAEEAGIETLPQVAIEALRARIRVIERSGPPPLGGLHEVAGGGTGEVGVSAAAFHAAGDCGLGAEIGAVVCNPARLVCPCESSSRGRPGPGDLSRNWTPVALSCCLT
jgi:hypothetical protein